MDPNFSQLHQQLGWIYLQKSMYEDALKEFQIESSDYWIGITYAKMGRMAEAQKVLNDSIKLANENYLLSYAIARFHFVIDEIDLGFKWMERAIEEKDPFLIWLSTDPLLDDVRSDPRFKGLLKKINLE
jgi:tetratricopeptide (TPR) repeat protein